MMIRWIGLAPWPWEFEFPFPEQAKVLDTRGKIPKRNAKGFLIFADFPDFNGTNLTPAEVLRLFGPTVSVFFFITLKSSVIHTVYEP